MYAVRIMVATAALVLAVGCELNKITVTGTVVNHVGIPLYAVFVLIGEPGPYNPAYTDENGHFTIEHVETPYDVYMDCYARVWPLAEVVYQGLTRSDPVLTIAVTPNEGVGTYPFSKQVTIPGQLSGGVLPQPADHLARVVFGAQEFYSLTNAADTGIFSWVCSWMGLNSAVGNLHALQWQFDGNDLPVLYTGYGTRGPVVLNNGDPLASQDITLGSITTGQVSGTAVLPAGYSLTLRTMGLRAGEHGYVPIVNEADPADPAFTYKVPELAGGTIAVSVQAENPAQDSSTATRVVAPGTSGISMSLPAAVSLLQPAAGATGVDGSTRFEWTPFAGGVHTFALTAMNPSSPGSTRTLTVVTAATSLTIDGLKNPITEFYLGELECAWTVSASTRCPTVDDAAGSFTSSVAPADSETAISALRTFTSAPKP